MTGTAPAETGTSRTTTPAAMALAAVMVRMALPLGGARPLLSVLPRSGPGKIDLAERIDRSAALAGDDAVGLVYVAPCAVLTSEQPGETRA